MTAHKRDPKRSFQLSMRMTGIGAAIISTRKLSTLSRVCGRDPDEEIKKLQEEAERIQKYPDYDPNYGWP